MTSCAQIWIQSRIPWSFYGAIKARSRLRQWASTCCAFVSSLSSFRLGRDRRARTFAASRYRREIVLKPTTSTSPAARKSIRPTAKSHCASRAKIFVMSDFNKMGERVEVKSIYTYPTWVNFNTWRYQRLRNYQSYLDDSCW